MPNDIGSTLSPNHFYVWQNPAGAAVEQMQ